MEVKSLVTGRVCVFGLVFLDGWYSLGGLGDENLCGQEGQQAMKMGTLNTLLQKLFLLRTGFD